MTNVGAHDWVPPGGVRLGALEARAWTCTGLTPERECLKSRHDSRPPAYEEGNALYAVDLDMGRELVGSATLLFDGPYPADLGYDVTPDGARFVMVRADERPGGPCRFS